MSTIEEICNSLDKAIELRRVKDGLDLLKANDRQIFSLDSTHEHAGCLVGRLSEWIDVDFSLLSLVERLLKDGFPSEKRDLLPHRDAVYLRLADGIVHMHRGNWKAGIDDLSYVLRSAIADSNLHVVANYCIGRCRSKLGEYEAALEYAHVARDRASGRVSQAAVITVLEAWLFFQKGQFDQAEALLNEAWKGLKSTDDWLSKGNIFSALGRIKRRQNLEQSLPLFETAISEYRKGGVGSKYSSDPRPQ